MRRYLKECVSDNVDIEPRFKLHIKRAYAMRSQNYRKKKVCRSYKNLRRLYFSKISIYRCVDRNWDFWQEILR